MRWKKIILITLPIVLLGLPLATGGAFYLAYRNKIFPQTYLGPWNVSGLTKQQAVKFLSKKINLPDKLTFFYQKRDFHFNPNDIELNYEIEKSVNQAFLSSRRELVTNRFKKKFVPLDYTLDESVLETKLATIAGQINEPTIPNQILLNENQEIEVKKGKSGKKLDLKQTIKAFLNNVQSYQLAQTIELITEEENNLPTEKEIVKAKNKANKLIGKSLTLSSKKQNFVIQQDQLINFVGFKEKWDSNKIEDYILILSESIDQKPENALFEFKEGKVITFKPHKKGYRLDQNDAATKIKQGLSELTNGEISLVKQLKVNSTEPKIKTPNTNRLGITELIGEGESTFHHSIPGRVHNIDLASSKLHGILVPNGGIFSLGDALGEVTTATGYKEAYIIKDGQTILGAGGGVCQVSTTLFRTALNTGLEILERHPHAYRVNYYEQDQPAGFDASVFFPTSDFKFKNDTNNYILIQREFDRENNYISFKFYGSPDKRKVTIDNHRVWDQVPPPEPLYIDDPGLPPEKVKQIERPARGAKAAFDWKVTKAGKTIHEKTFFSNYQAWQAKFLRGTEE